MQNLTGLIFDDRGGSWPIGTPHLASELRTSLCFDELEEYVIKNLGFVSLTSSTRGVQIKLRATKVSPIALAGALFWLGDHPQARILITSLAATGAEQSWKHEIVGRHRQQIQKLECLLDLSHLGQEQRFFQANISPNRLAHNQALDWFYREWSLGHLRECESVINACDTWFSGRFTIVRRDDDDQLVIAHAGAGYKCYGKDYMERATGSRLEDEPDWRYGKWVAEAHRNVFETGAPVIQDVDADIGPVTGTRDRFRYRRVLLPFSDKTGRQYVVTASLPEPNIDLRQASG